MFWAKKKIAGFCKDCKYKSRDKKRIVCKRYPTPIPKNPEDWCGEFK